MVVFQYDALDADKDSDDFFADAKSGIHRVIGAGQTVYWRGCTIQVFETGKEMEKPESTIALCSGQQLLRRGISLIFEKGQVKEV
jgi:hypothetical protein